MFRPDSNSDRTDYGNILMPPKGYKLESAVGTTYSLDLEALTSVAVCLGLSEEVDSRLMQNPICMLNALQKVSDRLILFCEAGQIKVPSKPTALSVLLEKIVVEVALPKDKGVGRYPAFHPKTWMLSYINSEGDRKYRFVVMSRNLTFDRSWDISFAMDSSKKVRQKRKSTPICNFLEYLARNVNKQCIDYLKKRNLIRKMMKEIKDISFSLDSKVFGENFEILPLGIGEKAYKIENDKLFCTQRGNADSTFNELVIMSPFLSGSVIADFNIADRALSECSRTLITRRSELGKLRECDVNNFTIYTLKDEIIDGEDEISDESSDKRKQDIHAKIYLRRKYADVDLYLGSMNASYSALNKNVEMMVKLGTKNKHLNGESFLDDIFCGNADDTKNPFEQVTIESVIDDTADINRDILEDKIKYLCRTKKIAYISKDDFNMDRYNIKIEFSGIDTDENIMISPINSKRKHILSEHMDFLDMEILQLSEFYKVEIKSGDTVLNRIIMIPTIGFPDNRENIVVNSVIGDKVSFIEYISLVLGDDYILSMIEGKQIRESGIFSKKSGIMPAIYEKMLKVAVAEPEKIKDIGYVLKMVNDSEIIPDEFRTLYETFCSTLKLKIQ
nr:phospholipase D family protein [uncultured Lachnoanaerobaculum sp.]